MEYACLCLAPGVWCSLLACQRCVLVTAGSRHKYAHLS